MKLSILFVCAFFKVSTGSEPQVYENVDDQIQVESKRVVRQPLIQLRANLYKPQDFRFEGTTQQDPRKFQYAQQQKVDMQNFLRRRKIVKEAPLRVSLVQNWKIDDPTVSSSTVLENYQIPEERMNSSTTFGDKVSTKKPVTSRKLKPSSYFDNVGEETIKRQDNNHIVYINPELVKNGRTDYDINALSALVGQNPNNQLEGLRRLLHNPHSDLVLSPIKTTEPHPITENVQDIPNPNTHPNVDTSVNLDTLQSQLDEAAKVQFAKALADAQQQAQAHVEAQHQAIAKAQEEAQKKALAQIAYHNQRIKESNFQGYHQVRGEVLPQPLALKQQASLAFHNQRIKEVAIPQVYHQVRGEVQRDPVVALHNQRIKEVAIPQDYHQVREEPVPVNFYAPSHGHREPNEELVKSRGNLKKIIRTQGHESASAYQQALLETQGQKVYPGVSPLGSDDNGDHHQYAARYAFGYKIRDVKMGNQFGHEEKRDGENAKGLYHVLLPDGRLQKVEYYADPSGYHAKVTYENLAHH